MTSFTAKHSWQCSTPLLYGLAMHCTVQRTAAHCQAQLIVPFLPHSVGSALCRCVKQQLEKKNALPTVLDSKTDYPAGQYKHAFNKKS